MTGVVGAGVLAGCVLLLVAGLGMVGSEAAGVQRMAGQAPRSGWSARTWAQALRDTVARRFAPHALALMTSKRRTEIGHRIDAAGRPGGLMLQEHAGNLAVSAILFGLLGLLLSLLLGSLLLVPALALLGWLLPDLSLLAQANRRQARIDRDLPDFLDVLAVTVSAGLGFRSALARVADALGGPLADEVRIALQQMSYGIASRRAFEGVRERNDSESLSKFMAALLQAEDLGTPLGDTLAAIADDMRKSFAQQARREAARAVPRVSLIIAVVMVPGFVVLMATALITASGTGFWRVFG